MNPCLAYIDPGAGTLLLQLLMAGVAGTVVFFRGAVRRLFSRVFRIKRPPGEGPEGHEAGKDNP